MSRKKKRENKIGGEMEGGVFEMESGEGLVSVVVEGVLVERMFSRYKCLVWNEKKVHLYKTCSQK